MCCVYLHDCIIVNARRKISSLYYTQSTPLLGNYIRKVTKFTHYTYVVKLSKIKIPFFVIFLLSVKINNRMTYLRYQQRIYVEVLQVVLFL